MASRRALVVGPANPSVHAELPVGDTLLGIPVKFGFVMSDSTVKYLPLNADYSLPFFMSNGTAKSTILVTING